MANPVRAEVNEATRQARARPVTGDADLLAQGIGHRQRWLDRSGLDARRFWPVKIAALMAPGTPTVPRAWQVRHALAAGVSRGDPLEFSPPSRQKLPVRKW
jgi:hypothetical protein